MREEVSSGGAASEAAGSGAVSATAAGSGSRAGAVSAIGAGAGSAIGSAGAATGTGTGAGAGAAAKEELSRGAVNRSGGSRNRWALPKEERLHIERKWTRQDSGRKRLALVRDAASGLDGGSVADVNRLSDGEHT